MKKLLAVAPLFLLLAACTTSVPLLADVNKQTFTCEDGGKVNVSYSADGDIAYLKVKLPEAGLANEKLTLKQAVAASGARYVSDFNPKVGYEWHTKADYGTMSINWTDGKEYSVSCDL